MDKVVLEFERHLVNPDAPPKQASRFTYAVVDNAISLEVSYMDTHDVHVAIRDAKQAKKAGKQHSAKLKLFVTDRFILTPEAAMDLKIQADALVDHLRKFGKIPVEDKDAAN